MQVNAEPCSEESKVRLADVSLVSPAGVYVRGVKVAYLPAEEEIVADVDLPLLDAVPELAS